MGDDIDDLLDEVESKFCGNKKPLAKKTDVANVQKSKPKPTQQTSSKKSNFSEDLSNVIDDIMADDGFDLQLNKNPQTSIGKISSAIGVNGQVKLKCASIYIGGSSSQQGASSGTNSQCCDRLHCTSCDNEIVCFENFKWDEGQCDYLAFRNNYPDYSRLKHLLMPRKGYRTYCCQCSWLSSKEMVPLKELKPEFKWVCKKH